MKALYLYIKDALFFSHFWKGTAIVQQLFCIKKKGRLTSCTMYVCYMLQKAVLFQLSSLGYTQFHICYNMPSKFFKIYFSKTCSIFICNYFLLSFYLIQSLSEIPISFSYLKFMSWFWKNAHLSAQQNIKRTKQKLGILVLSSWQEM